MNTTGSVAPPGWTPPATSGSVRPPAVGVRALPGSIDRSRTPVPGVVARPDAALRARMAAVFVDGFLASCISGVLYIAFRWSPDMAAVVNLLVTALYFAAFEMRDGRTPGKRRYGLKVVMVADGSPPTMRAVALRSVLRPVDMFPLAYTSGIVSVLRTGPERRQRLGDMLAGTTVVPSGDRPVVRTPGWYLPVAAIVSVLLSALVIFGGVEARRTGSPAERRDFVATCAESGAPAASCVCIYDQVGRREIIRLDRAVRAGDERTSAAIRAEIAQVCGGP